MTFTVSRSWTVGSLLLATVALAWAADRVIVEEWSRIPAGTKGLPPDWKGQSWGSPKYDFAVVDNDGKRVLHLKSRDEGSTIARDIKGKVDLKATPILEWSWRVVTLPKGGNSCKKSTDDQAAQVYVAWRRFPEALRSRIVGYVWDTTAPVGTTCKSEKASTVTYVVLRSGSAELGRWITEARNVGEDFRKIYGEEPDAPDAVSISIDTNDTSSVAEAFIGPILFRKP
jgi:Protein of unknown function (DUF3047)